MLAVALTQQQVDAACRLHQRLKQWRLADAALLRLRDLAPGFDSESCVLKAVAVNTLYGTQVMAIVRMAEHVKTVIAKVELNRAGSDLVERIAALPDAAGTVERRFISFAAKFCHFFVDEERFPIYDEGARNAIELHLGSDAVVIDDIHPYGVYCQNLMRLRVEAMINGPCRNLDRYLWIVGMYIKWRALREKPKQRMNVELRELFETPDVSAAVELNALLPPVLRGAF